MAMVTVTTVMIMMMMIKHNNDDDDTSASYDNDKTVKIMPVMVNCVNFPTEKNANSFVLLSCSNCSWGNHVTAVLLDASLGGNQLLKQWIHATAMYTARFVISLVS